MTLRAAFPAHADSFGLDVAFDLEFYSRLSNLVTWGSAARRRVGFFVRQNRIRDGVCPECGTKIDGVGMSGV